MAVLKPFQAIRPKKGLEEQMAALPYDVYNRAEAKVVVEKNPLSFLAIDRAETQFPDDVDTYADCVYDKAKEMLWDRVAKGEYIQENEKCYYVYELVCIIIIRLFILRKHYFLFANVFVCFSKKIVSVNNISYFINLSSIQQ